MLIAGLGLAAHAHPAPASRSFPTALAFALYFAMLAIGFAPRLLGVLDILLQPARRARYGGARTAAWRARSSTSSSPCSSARS